MINSITTFGELRNALPSTGDRRVPGIRQLRSKAKLLLKKETATGIIEIFDNGFFLFEECGRGTVYGVDRCADMRTYDRFVKRKMTDEFDPYPWELILESVASARLDHNSESREENQSVISIDAPESEHNIALSVRPEHEKREEEEDMSVWHVAKKRQMKSALEKLTEKQYSILLMYRVEKLTQEQIADRMGISRRTLREHLEAIEKKLKKYS